MALKLNLIVAASENWGIGKNGTLPWKLKKEMAFFRTMTSATEDKSKKNVVIMGRRTWESIPAQFKPLPNRINFVLSRSGLNLDQYSNTQSFTSFREALDKLEESAFRQLYENVWIIGGSSLYNETFRSPHFHRLYLTKIHKEFDCDTFLPALPGNLKEISDPAVTEDIQEENDIEYTFQVFEVTN
ncbi:dihydrofolate reductase isoform X1 [Dendroctonus ponderosae]|uniref:dihydrofolate reductase n=2 Tax=Dendroctonus ponderosae TaxID=77166 RepID=U4UMY1_DENPD|nr:dihydrofolate reductase isoform X1 [Dendroctonus ponderosae]ERL91355.1 hypothetical protein D910_08687 [Dendroctonus ponderosae]KAH1006793.1 hypothetical protein HUJ05_007496 [Dendroctonus ponderosae]